ncbi:MAG TPA: FecR domain-containing protein [Rhizomicrobium sp.]|nr:FecR domain-containing protein [Rhizomicrobium sp.]
MSAADLPNASDVEQTAADWLEHRASDDWSEARDAELEIWLAQSPAHAVAFMRLEAAWNRTTRLAALQQPMLRKPLQGTTQPSRRPALKIAAAVMVTAAISVGGSLLAVHQKDQTFATTIGGREALSLVDGSKIELNTDTVLRMANGAGERKVWLDRGEAYFDIKHDAAHPFVVMVGDHRVTDLGTKFIVRQEGDRVEVKLLEGSARLDANSGLPAQSAVLKPGDVAIATADQTSVTKKPVKELTQELGWRRGVLTFDHTTLAEAVAEFNRYNRQKIVIADRAAAKLEIGGTFPSDDVKLFGRATHIALGLRVEDKGNQLVISQ